MTRKFKHKKLGWIATVEDSNCWAEIKDDGRLRPVMAKELILNSCDWVQIIKKWLGNNGENSIYEGDNVYLVDDNFRLLYSQYITAVDLDGKHGRWFTTQEKAQEYIDNNTKVLFVTEDGVEIKNNYLAVLYNCMKNITCKGEQILHYSKYTVKDFLQINPENRKEILFFADESKCKQYIEDNTPKYSKQKIKEVLENNKYFMNAPIIDKGFYTFKILNVSSIEDVLKELDINE